MIDIDIEIEKVKARMVDDKSLPGSGWYQIIATLNRKLEMLDPEYKIFQIKEKFGSLRYYYESDVKISAVKEAMNRYIRYAEMQSIQTCEECGANAKPRKTNYGWMKTRCDNCHLLMTPVKDPNEKHTR